MKKSRLAFIVLITISLQLLIFSQEIGDKKIVFSETTYDPFFSVDIVDNEGEAFKVSRVAFFDEYNERKFFFWVRRNSGLYNLSFKNIKRITFDEDDLADDRYINFTRCRIELMSGEDYLVYLKTTGHIEGWDEEFGSAVTFYLHYNLIESIEFNHEGDYYYCPFCETIYFGDDHDRCIYDDTPLTKGVLSDSDK